VFVYNAIVMGTGNGVVEFSYYCDQFARMLWQMAWDILYIYLQPRCQRYWPNEGETLQFDGISVTLVGLW